MINAKITKTVKKINNKKITKKKKEKQHTKKNKFSKKRSHKKTRIINKKNKITRRVKKKTKLKKSQIGSGRGTNFKHDVDEQLLLKINQRAQNLVNMKIQELNKNFKARDKKYENNVNFNLIVNFTNSNNQNVNINNLFTYYLNIDDFKKVMEFKLNSNVKKFKYKKVGDLFKDIYIKIEFDVNSNKNNGTLEYKVFYNLYDFYKKIKKITPKILNNFAKNVSTIDKKTYKKNKNSDSVYIPRFRYFFKL